MYKLYKGMPPKTTSTNARYQKYVKHSLTLQAMKHSLIGYPKKQRKESLKFPQNRSFTVKKGRPRNNEICTPFHR